MDGGTAAFPRPAGPQPLAEGIAAVDPSVQDAPEGQSAFSDVAATQVGRVAGETRVMQNPGFGCGKA